MIASPNFSSRGGRAVRLVAIHTAEGALTAAALGNYFANPSSQVSSHVGIDSGTVVQYVDYVYEAWAMLDANPIADQAELCGFTAMTRAQWLSYTDQTFFWAPGNRTVTVTSPQAMLDRAAAWIRERCLARGIPIVKLTPSQVGAGQAGVCGHWDWTLGTGEGTHTDPGAGFPWDYVMQRAANPPAPPNPSDDEESDMVDKIYLAAGTKFPHGLYHDGAGNYIGLANEAEKANLAASGARVCDGITEANASELLRLSRVGKDTPEPTSVVAPPAA